MGLFLFLLRRNDSTLFVIIQCITVTVQIAPIIRQFKAQNVSLHV